jgi:hypothetical protein
MGRRVPGSVGFSRRAFVASVGVSTLPSDGQSAAGLHPFELWRAERLALEGELDRTPEAQDADGRRERLFDRVFELEHLILTTPSADLAAMQVKAATLVWLMEMDGSDGLPAMRQIQAYIKGQR